MFLQPIGFVIYMTAGIAETNRAPFDFPEAEQELVAGYHTEYSSMSFAMFFLAEYVNMVTVSAVATNLFLGGWHGPFLPEWLGFVWFFLKLAAMLFFYLWLRWTLPRYRYDQLMQFGWKVLLPLSSSTCSSRLPECSTLAFETILFYLFGALAVGALAARHRAAQSRLQRAAADRVVRRAGGPVRPARRPVHRGHADHRLRRRDHGALPLRRHAAERAAQRTRRNTTDRIRSTGRSRGASARCSGRASSRELAWAVWHVSTRQPAALAETAPGKVSSVREIGRVLFTDYAFPFEATSMLILVAMVGAVILARQDAE